MCSNWLKETIIIENEVGIHDGWPQLYQSHVSRDSRDMLQIRDHINVMLQKVWLFYVSTPN